MDVGTMIFVVALIVLLCVGLAYGPKAVLWCIATPILASIALLGIGQMVQNAECKKSVALATELRAKGQRYDIFLYDCGLSYYTERGFSEREVVGQWKGWNK